MTNRKLLKILLQDKMQRDLKEYKFKSQCYWQEFLDFKFLSSWDFPLLVEERIKYLNELSLTQLKEIYALFLFFKEKDIKYGGKNDSRRNDFIDKLIEENEKELK